VIFTHTLYLVEMEGTESPEFFPLYHYQYRIILIGDSTVGKSSLLRFFSDNRCAGIIEPTVG
jgi:GTPase SAR1 family protein